jgi:GNAT superfamily N-acetyltransferase
MKMDDPDYDFELAKMAVSPKAQGKGVGFLLGNASIERAKARDGKMLYLESNTLLKQAINLYHKLGFKKVVGRSTPYERCNIQMELNLTSNN